MSRPYNSNEAQTLLKDLNDTYTGSLSINTEKYVSSHGNLCNRTKTLISSGLFSNCISDVTPIVNSLQDTTVYLENAIKKFESIDKGVDSGNEAFDGVMNNILDKFYTDKYGDMYVRIDGKPYVLFSQTGHGFEDEGENSPLLTQFFLFTDGDKGGKGRGTSLYGASCSFCSTLNCIVALKGYDFVMEHTGANKYFNDFYKDCGSMNAASLAAVNKAFTEDWLNACNPKVSYDALSPSAKVMRDKYVTSTDFSEDKVQKWEDMLATKSALGSGIPGSIKFTNNDNKPRGIDTFVDSYFGKELVSLTGDYGSGYSVKRANDTIGKYFQQQGYDGDVDFEKMVDDGTVKMVIRMPKNSSDSARYKSGAGHYIASVESSNDGTLNYVILDSAIDIDVRSDSVLDDNNRIGYVPKDFFTKSKKGPVGVIYILDNEKLDEYLNNS